MPIRSGRFKVELASAGEIRIVKGRSGAFYRIFNSGEDAFSVTAGAPDSTTLEKGFSLDVAVFDEVVVSTSGKAVVEGIYDYVDTQRPIRSGRFRLKSAPASHHKIIDLRHSGQKRRAFYRIFNSGEKNAFNVMVDGVLCPYPAAPDKGLDPNQSLDFEVGYGSRDVYVVAVDQYPIEGIYEFLGVEN